MNQIRAVYSHYFSELEPHKIQELNKRMKGEVPFPHISIDGFFSDLMLDKIIGEFPESSDQIWNQHFHKNSNKLSFGYKKTLGLVTIGLISELNSPKFLVLLEQLSGIDGLIPDPYLFGGGLHLSSRGGFLNIHADFNKHPKWNLYRRLNLILYLNHDWKPDYGGQLELWDSFSNRRIKEFDPIFNRMVIFETSDISLHGHPTPNTCPEGKARRSIALYYYSSKRGDNSAESSHDTLYK